jgi:hypothetical protein
MPTLTEQELSALVSDLVSAAEEAAPRLRVLAQVKTDLALVEDLEQATAAVRRAYAQRPRASEPSEQS